MRSILLVICNSTLKEKYMEHNVVGWFEIYVEDMDRAQKFYETVLAVKMEKMINTPADMMVFPMEMNLMGAAGALVKMDGFAPASNGGVNSVLIYFICDDCATEAARVTAAGGRIQREKMSIGQYGFIALAYDSEGNMFGLHSMR